jgi:hypothetical protein
MKTTLLTVLLLFSLALEAKTTSTTLCQAIKSDNHALVKSKLKHGKVLKENYEKHKCFNRSLLEHAEKSPKVREYLTRHLPYETIAREAKDGRKVL